MTVYESDVLRLELTELDHHVIRMAFELAAVVVRDAERGVLMLHRHRFIIDRWLWDVPAGKLARDESPSDAAVRASVDETGWRPYGVRLLGSYHPLPGITDQRVHVCVADGADQVGELNPDECDRVEWIPPARVRELDVDGPSLTALLWALG
jgi:8-oxo-dGTP pyrophosphatase MutT (NUDIX family)